MTTRSADVVDCFHDALNTRAPDDASGLCTPDCTWSLALFGLEKEGDTAAQDVVELFSTLFEDVKIRQDSRRDGDASIMVEATLVAVHSRQLPGELYDLLPLGKRFSIVAREYFELRDGLIYAATLTVRVSELRAQLDPPRFTAFEGHPLSLTSLDRHLLIVGQSGSGKSYFMGTLMEELATKSRARLVVLDRAGDFLRMSTAADGVGRSGIPTSVYTNWLLSNRRDQPVADAGSDDVRVESVSVHSTWFTPHDQCAVLSLPIVPKYWTILGEAQKWIEHHLKQNNVPEYAILGKPFYDLPTLLHGCASLNDADSSFLPPSELLSIGALDAITDGLLTAHRNQGELQIGAKGADSEHVARTMEFDTPAKVAAGTGLQVIDLSSLGTEHARHVMMLAILRSLWATAVAQWWRRNEAKAADHTYARTPTFIFLDEAHHFVSQDVPESPIAMRVREAILELATEGRKFGLWLVCGTQRPTRLHPTILSETSNFVLMRTGSPLDLDLLAKHFDNDRIRFDLPGLKRREGRAYLAGEWAETGFDPVKTRKRFSYHPEGTLDPREWLPAKAE